MRSLTMAGAAALYLPMLKLTQVSLTARPARAVCCCACPHRASHPQRSLASDCTPWVAGGYRTLPWNLLSMGAQRQRAAAAWRRAGARGADRGATAVCASGRRGPRSTARCRSRQQTAACVSSSLPLSAGWPVHPDPLPSCVAHRVSRSVLECVCTVNSKIVRTWPT